MDVLKVMWALQIGYFSREGNIKRNFVLCHTFTFYGVENFRLRYVESKIVTNVNIFVSLDE